MPARIMNRRLPIVFILTTILLIMGCGVKVDLPTSTVSSEPVFGAGDTSYIRISPDWDDDAGFEFNKPWDLAVGADGYIFVADGDAPRIHVISAAGNQLSTDAYGNDFTDLMDIQGADGLPFKPQVIDQDSRLNLFMADGGNTLMVWNQYLDNVGVDSIAVAILMQSPMDDLLWVTNFDSITTLQGQNWDIADIRWSHEGVDVWQAPRVFWDASDSLEAIQAGRFFVDPENMKITGISSYHDMCSIADANANVILGLSYVPAALLLTGAGNPILAYRGTLVERTVSNGTGNGTVNDPRGMIHAPDGALFYTQWGENFSVHKVGGSSGFEYGEDDIMDIERFSMASDIALDPLGNIYVADTGNDRIQQFTSTGVFAFNIGMSKIRMDSTIYDSSLVDSEWVISERDTSFTIEVADILNTPRSVAVDATGIVYIADTEHNRIMRFRLSTELDYTVEN